MRILVASHSLQIGGSQLVAINLGWAMKDRGHDVTIYGPPGPLAEFATDRGLTVIQRPRRDGARPTVRGAKQLRDVIRGAPFDLLHAYGHQVCLEAYFGSHLLEGIPLVCSERGGGVPRSLPKHLPLIMAHQPLAEAARRLGYREVHLMRPVVDTEANHPQAVAGSDFLKEHGLDDGSASVVLVSRLARGVKLEGLQRAIDAVGSLPSSVPVRLVVVGGGKAEEELRERAQAVNARAGRQAVFFTGPMLDPRPAYAAADVVLGMQGSILRGMAFEKPAIVLGERGFSDVVSETTVDRFVQEGFYGLGNEDIGHERLADQIMNLLMDPDLQNRLGRFSREVVCQHVSLVAAADQLEAIYEQALRAPVRRSHRVTGAIGFSSAVIGRRLGRLARPRTKPVARKSVRRSA